MCASRLIQRRVCSRFHAFDMSGTKEESHIKNIVIIVHSCIVEAEISVKHPRSAVNYPNRCFDLANNAGNSHKTIKFDLSPLRCPKHVTAIVIQA